MHNIASRASRVNRPRKRRRNNQSGWGNEPSYAPPSRRAYHDGGSSDHPDAARIINALGGYGGLCRCPCHDDRRPSLSVDYRGGRVLVKCFGGCSQATLVEYFKRRGLWPSSSPRPQREAKSDRSDLAEHSQASENRERAADAEGRRQRALAVLDAADADEWPKLRPYLRNRYLDDVPEGARWLSQRDARRLRREYPELGLKAFPAMVFGIIRAGTIVGAHVTHLTADGSKKLVCDDPRRTLGPIKGGHVVLGEAHRDLPLIIGEGIESTLAKMAMDGWPGIAAFSATNMADLNLNLPPCLEIVIAADNDLSNTGIDAARILGRRLVACGFKVRSIEKPPRPENWKERSYDFADQLLRQQRR
jgi:hypothetical protein